MDTIDVLLQKMKDGCAKVGRPVPIRRQRTERKQQLPSYTSFHEMGFIDHLTSKIALEGYIIAMLNGEHRVWTPEQVDQFCKRAEERLREL